MTDFLGPKSSISFHCKNCDYFTSNKSQYNRHILTLKHNRLTNTEQILTDLSSNSTSAKYIGNRGKNYKNKQSLFNQKKKRNNV